MTKLVPIIMSFKGRGWINQSFASIFFGKPFPKISGRKSKSKAQERQVYGH